MSAMEKNLLLQQFYLISVHTAIYKCDLSNLPGSYFTYYLHSLQKQNGYIF